MFTAVIAKFVKDKLFSTSGILLLVFGIIFSVFLFSNSSVILSKFGFETTTTLKAELTRVQGELKQLKTINDGLNKTVEDLQKNKKQTEEVLIESFTEKEAVKEKVNDIKIKKEKKIKDLNKTVEDKTSTTETTTTIPTVEYNQLSEANIDSLHQVYNTLFPEGETK